MFIVNYRMPKLDEENLLDLAVKLAESKTKNMIKSNFDLLDDDHD